jgi:hypothetical protein
VISIFPTVGSKQLNKILNLGFPLFTCPHIGRGNEAWSRHMGVRFETWAARKEKPTPSHQNDSKIKHTGHP